MNTLDVIRRREVEDDFANISLRAEATLELGGREDASATSLAEFRVS
jgi:hypothetical protein